MIILSDMQKNYSSFSLNVSLKLPEGRVSALVGRNGAGKSTIIKSIVGLIPVDGGSARVFDKDSRALTAFDKERLGVAFSDSGFSTYLCVEDIIRILKNSYRQFDEDAFRGNCAAMDIPFKKKLKEFSTGMSAKLKVLIATSHNADLLILDEPTAGLDIVARNEILDMLRRYLAADSKRSMLISSHISSDLEGLCDDIYMLHNGKIILHEDTDVLLNDYCVLKTDAVGFEGLDKRYILKTVKSSFGYSCFTDRKQFYSENYPGLVIENGNIDDMIIMMSEGDDIK